MSYRCDIGISHVTKLNGIIESVCPCFSLTGVSPVFVRTISFCSQTWHDSASIIIWLVATPQERRLSWRARPLREIVVLKYNVFLCFCFCFVLYALCSELLIFLQPVLFSRCISITECAYETDVFLVKIRARAQNFRDYSSEYEPVSYTHLTLPTKDCV